MPWSYFFKVRCFLHSNMKRSLYSFIRAGITNYGKLGDFKATEIHSHSSRDEKCEIKVFAGPHSF